MADLYGKIQEDLKLALKARGKTELAALRLLKSDIQYEATRTGAKTIPDETVEALIKKAIKKRKEAMAQFISADRTEQAAQEEAELKILERYLPEEVSADEIRKTLEKLMAEMNASAPGDLGKIMGRTMASFKGRNIDGAVVREIARELLGE